MIGRCVESFIGKGQTKTFNQIVIQFLVFRIGELRRDQTSQPLGLVAIERLLRNMSNGDRKNRIILIAGPIEWNSEPLTQQISRDGCIYKMAVWVEFLHSHTAINTPRNNE